MLTMEWPCDDGVHIVAIGLIRIAFKNVLISHRGAIRQSHDVLAWIQKLEKVSAATGVTPDDVLTTKAAGRMYFL